MPTDAADRARRGAPAAALAVAAVLAALAPAQAAARDDGGPGSGRDGTGFGPPRALVVFAPVGVEPLDRIPLLPDLEGRGDLAIGLSSASLGPYLRQQALLDMSQGSRIATGSYPRQLRPLFLDRGDGGWRIEGWRAAVRRARGAPGELVPGLLAERVRREGGEVAYAGVRSALQGEAIVAADRSGRVGRVSLGSGDTLVARALRLWRRSTLVVVQLPRGEGRLPALDRFLEARSPTDLVYVVRGPSVVERLLPTAVAAEGFDGLLTSPTTRRSGLVTATDLAPTVLARLGLKVPGAMQGRPVTGGAPGGVAELKTLSRRMDVIPERRFQALLWCLVAWAALVVLLTALRRGRGLRTGLRIGLLGMLWLPGVALVTGGLGLSASAEFPALAISALALAAATDRWCPWPAAPAVPALVVLVAHAIDLALGSPLIATSLAGPRPRGGARFFGVGNELEALLGVTLLVGTGAAMAWRPSPRPVRGFLVATVVGAVVIGAGRLGADVGGVLTLAAGGAAAVVVLRGGHPGRRGWQLIVAAPIVALAGLAVLDLVTRGGAHFSAFVLDASGPAEIWDTIRRRYELAFGVLTTSPMPIVVPALVVVFALAIRGRHRLLAPLERAGPRRADAFRAGLWGALVAIVFGSLVNDSGPNLFVIGAVPLMLAAAYAWASPLSEPPPAPARATAYREGPRAPAPRSGTPTGGS